MNAGELITNPVTRETIIWLETALQTNGDYTRYKLCVKAGGFSSHSMHILPQQSVQIEILQGQMCIAMGDYEFSLQKGEIFDIPANVPRMWRNNSTENLQAIVEVRPALNFEYLTATTFALAHEGKVDPNGNVDLLYSSLFALKHLNELVPAQEPRWAVWTTLTMLRPVALLMGLRLPRIPLPTPASQPPNSAALSM